MAKSIAEIIKETEECMMAHELDKAHEIIDASINILDNTDLAPKDTEDTEYKSFFEPIQEVIYYHLIKDNNKKLILTEEDYSALYRTYGRLLIEEERYEDAKAPLIKALKWNPVNLVAKFEYSLAYKALGDWDMYLALNGECLKYGYYTEAIARAYSAMTLYYIHHGNFKLATAIIFVAMEFDKDLDEVKRAYKLLTEALGREPKMPPTKKANKLFRSHSIQWGASDEIISTVYSYGQHYIKSVNYKSARYFLRYAYSLSADRQILRLLKVLPTY